LLGTIFAGGRPKSLASWIGLAEFVAAGTYNNTNRRIVIDGLHVIQNTIVERTAMLLFVFMAARHG
jgi:hypothetical protein